MHCCCTWQVWKAHKSLADCASWIVIVTNRLDMHYFMCAFGYHDHVQHLQVCLADCRDALQTAGMLKVCRDACMQHRMERFWSIQCTCYESQHRWSLPSAMLAVHSCCKQLAAMHACYAFCTIAILVNALQQSMNPIEWYPELLVRTVQQIAHGNVIRCSVYVQLC